MQRAWLLDTVCVTVAEVDFLDPALRFEIGARERGVRVEIRPATAAPAGGTVYASDPITMRPAICRIDLLESQPGAADRMHWHPVMHAGEPGERTFDAALSADPLGWLGDRLRDVRTLLSGADADVTAHDEHVADPMAGVVEVAEVAEVARLADEIVAAVRVGLENCRTAWPDVEHDDRGMAIANPGSSGHHRP